VRTEPADVSHPGTDFPSLIELMSMDEAEWKAFSGGSPLTRPKRAGFLRNVAVALGNWGSPEAAPVLSSALSDPAPLVRGHAAWALGQVGSSEAAAALEERLAVESDSFVIDEIERALSSMRVVGGP
jgi:epoxyqueuosine reductase